MTRQPAYDHVDDWPRLCRRMVDFWDGRLPTGGIIAHVQNPNPSFGPPPQPWMARPTEDDFLSPERFYHRQLWLRSSWNHHGDLYPYAGTGWGPNMFAGFIGAPVVFGERTVWHEPVIEPIDRADRLHFNPDGTRWRQHLRVVDWFAEHVVPHRPVAVTDFGGPADWLSVCMGTEAMLMACATEPEAVHDVACRLARECCGAFDVVAGKLMSRGDGMVNWMPVWCDRAMMTVQDDIAVTLSPGMYRDVFGDAVDILAAHAPACTLHWHDAAAPQAEVLLDVEAIDVVQFGHDPDQVDFRRHLPTMQRIQGAGKRLFISCVEHRDVDFFLDELDHAGLMMIVNTPDDESSRAMVDHIAQRS